MTERHTPESGKTTARRTTKRRRRPAQEDGSVVQLDDETARKLEQMRAVSGNMSATVVARLVFGLVSVQQFAECAAEMVLKNATAAGESADRRTPDSVREGQQASGTHSAGKA